MRPDRQPRKSGAEAEALARRFLEQQGLQFIECNYHCRLGEIDLIMQEGSTLVFVEVRYRRHAAFGSAAESVIPAKQRRIIATATHFLQSKQLTGQLPCRFDVLAMAEKETQNIDWIKDAFQSSNN